MASAFEWLNNTIQALGQLIPRILLIRSTMRVALFRYNGKIRVLDPGLTWYWPITSEIRYVPITVRSWEIGSMGFCSDDKALIWHRLKMPLSTFIKCSIQIRIVDVLKSIEAYDIKSVTLTACKLSLTKQWKGAVDDSFTERTRLHLVEELGKFGIEVERFGITDHYTSVMFGARTNDHDYVSDHFDHDSQNL